MYVFKVSLPACAEWQADSSDSDEKIKKKKKEKEEEEEEAPFERE